MLLTLHWEAGGCARGGLGAGRGESRLAGGRGARSSALWSVLVVRTRRHLVRQAQARWIVPPPRQSVRGRGATSPFWPSGAQFRPRRRQRSVLLFRRAVSSPLCHPRATSGCARMRLSLLALVALVVPLVAAGLSPFSSSGASAMTFCKCLCFTNSTILPLCAPVRSSPCPTAPPDTHPQTFPRTRCTRASPARVSSVSIRNFPRASAQSPVTRTSTPARARAATSRRAVSVRASLLTSAVRADCSQYYHPPAERDSPKSHFIVVAFIVVTSSLLFGAGLKQFAGFDIQDTWSRGGVRGVISVS